MHVFSDTIFNLAVHTDVEILFLIENIAATSLQTDPGTLKLIKQ